MRGLLSLVVAARWKSDESRERSDAGSRRRSHPQLTERVARMARKSRREPFLSAAQVGKRLGLSAALVMRGYRAGLIPGCRRRDGLVVFRWSEVVDAWDGARQLSFDDESDEAA